MTRAVITEDSDPYRVVVDFLNPDGAIRARTCLGPYGTKGAASGQATYARNQATRNGGKVRTRVQRALPVWETIEEVTE
jgi:hypothetical protein